MTTPHRPITDSNIQDAFGINTQQRCRGPSQIKSSTQKKKKQKTKQNKKPK
jgi:hypothetical protein